MNTKLIEMLKNARRILIIGDAGRGKSTFSVKIGKKLNLPVYSTDDYFWKEKYTIPNDRQKSIEDIKKIYSNEDWVVEGSSTHLFQHGLNRADIIIQLKFPGIFSQWWALIKRSRQRKNESFTQLIRFLIYITRKRYNIGYKKEIKNIELLKPFNNKIFIIKSHSDMDSLLDRLS